MTKTAIFWHRRDLRIHDNCGLFHALKSGYPVVPIFIFDCDILDKLEDKDDPRITFIYDQLIRLKEKYNALGSDLRIYFGKVKEVWKIVVNEHDPVKVFFNHDYEPYAINRDFEIRKLLEEREISLETFKDQVILEKGEVLKDDGNPYTVFTPYSKKWKQRIQADPLIEYDLNSLLPNLALLEKEEVISMDAIGFERTKISFPNAEIDEDVIKAYHLNRDIPSKHGTSRLSVHLRFGTISIRALVNVALELNETWLNELIWREFYMMILFHFPHVVKRSFRAKYDRIPWRNNEKEFEAWCKGKTGYPIVDAGMRQLNQTGFMHNRVRMIVASFLTKHLLIDWLWGEAYFAKKLLDYELSSNNGGWQWAAGTGCDAAPYFRVFNPYTQTEKFDRDLKYIRTWLPEFEDPIVYPKPIVEHKFARERALSTYKLALA